MGRPKIARKSTWVDMTAFCDVAFLLLSFFIMATKTKPPEAVAVMMPSSVSSKAVPETDQVMVIINKEGKVFLSISEPAKRKEIVEAVGKVKGVPITPATLQKATAVEFFGSPIAQINAYVDLPKGDLTGEKLPGIPAKDSTNNEVTDWMAAVNSVYFGSKMNLLVKSDNAAKYPAFKQVLDAFKRNEMLKFSIVTNAEDIPEGSELFKDNKAKGAGK